MKKTLSVFCIIFSLILLTSCDRSDDNARNMNNGQSQAQRKRGILLEHGVEIQLNLLKKVRLESEGDGFIQSLRDLKFKQNRFYALDKIGAAITLFDSTGKYLKSIQVDTTAGPSRLLVDLMITNDTDIYVKDERLHTIFHLNPNGEIVSKIENPDLRRGAARITFGGLEVMESGTGQVIYSTIFNHLPSDDYLKHSFLVGAFNQRGQLLRQFAQHSPDYAKFNLINFHVSTFAIWEDELYLLESASHLIRVFTLSGELKRGFGEHGYHQRVIDRPLKKNANLEETKTFTLIYSSFDKIFVIPKLASLAHPVVAVSYSNAIVGEDRSKTLGIDVYLMLYRTDGQLLVNDINLPGYLFDIIDTGNRPLLLINLDNTPTNRIIGIYDLQLTKP